jgi:hypothetical protein
MGRWLPAGLAALAVTATAIIHGIWVGRWDQASAAGTTTEVLERIPMRLGDWEGQPLELSSREAKQYSGVFYRRYIHTQTGVAVAVVIVAGRAGPVSIHSPDYCYPASGYERAAWLPYALTYDKAQAPAQFKTALLTKTQAANQTHVRVLWSWYSSGAWSVPDDPRWTFAGQTCLYKIHVVRETASASETLENDPCLDLLRQVLVAFKQRVASGE